MEFLKKFSGVVHNLYLDHEDRKLLSHFASKNGEQNDTLYYQLLRGVDEEKISDDNGAASYLFDASLSNNTHKLSNVKHRLTEKLGNLVFLVNPKRYGWTAYKKKFFECYKYFLIGKFLRYLNFREGSIVFAKRAFKISRDYQFYDIHASIASTLADLRSVEGDVKGYKYYKNSSLDAIQKWSAEQEIKFHYLDIATELIRTSKLTDQLEQKIINYLQKARENYKVHQTYLLYVYLIRFEAFYWEIKYDFKKVLDTWEAFDEYLKKNPRFYNASQVAESFLKRMSACLNLRNYEQGEKYGQQANEKFKEGKLNWFIFNEYYFILMMHKGDYQSAYNIINKIMKHSMFDHLPDINKERWLLFNGFVNFVKEAGLDPAFSNQYYGKTRFKINKLINQLPTQSKDKYGVNTLIHILNYLFLLNRNEIDNLESLQEPLRQYRYRYLRFKNNQKMNLFVKMLLKVPNKSFSASKVQSATQKDHEKLAGTDFRYQGGYEDLEVIPYERLWEWILSRLWR